MEKVLIKKYFEIKKDKRLVKLDRVDGNTPLVTAGEKAEGIKEYINTILSEMPIFEAGTITADMFGNVFVRDYTYSADDNVHILKFKQEVSDEVLLYLAATIKYFLSQSYSYGRQLRLSRLERDYIYLPLREDGSLDIEYISNISKTE